MRVEFKEPIAIKLANLHHELHTVNKLQWVEAVYLTQSEWDELKNYLGLAMFSTKRVAIHQPFRVDWNYHSGQVNYNIPVITTEEINYYGFKVRKEYK